MKKIIILLLATNFCYGQIPKNNRAILKATEKYIGRKVGNGICRDLRDSVLMDTKLGTPQIHRKSQILTVGYYRDILSKRKKAYPGDLIEFKDVVTKDMLYPHHVAIVYAKINKNEYYIAHQNTRLDSLKESMVIITKFSLSSIKSGTVEFHRVR